MSWVGLGVFGFLLGMRHALEADHVAAVASLTDRNTSFAQAARLGAAWGLGHTLTLLVFGTVVLAADTLVSERLAWALELGVGLMLVGLGADVLRRLVRSKVHFHVHRHDDGTTHFHAHSHEDEDAHRHDHGGLPKRAIFVGSMHGMAGSAALVLLTVSRAPSLLGGLLYIGIFGLGSILGMALLSTAIAVPLRYSARTFTWMGNGLQGAIGAGTIAIGLALIYSLVHA